MKKPTLQKPATAVATPRAAAEHVSRIPLRDVTPGPPSYGVSCADGPPCRGVHGEVSSPTSRPIPLPLRSGATFAELSRAGLHRGKLESGGGEGRPFDDSQRPVGHPSASAWDTKSAAPRCKCEVFDAGRSYTGGRAEDVPRVREFAAVDIDPRFAEILPRVTPGRHRLTPRCLRWERVGYDITNRDVVAAIAAAWAYAYFSTPHELTEGWSYYDDYDTKFMEAFRRYVSRDDRFDALIRSGLYHDQMGRCAMEAFRGPTPPVKASIPECVVYRSEAGLDPTWCARPENVNSSSWPTRTFNVLGGDPDIATAVAINGCESWHCAEWSGR